MTLNSDTDAYRDQLIKTRCELDLSFFIRYVFKEFYGLTWVHNWHHDEIIRVIYALERREIPNAVINMPPRYGKAIDQSTPMLTGRGWVQAADVKVGDRLIASNGKWTNVTGVYPQGVTDAYNVVFSDGTSLVTCGQHLWQVSQRYSQKPRIKQTGQLIHDLHESDGRKKWKIPLLEPWAGCERDLPIDPYLFGCWLGDGSAYKAEICTADPEIRQAFEDSYYVTERTHQNAGKATELGIRSNFITKLKALGVVGCKFVPEQYLLASSRDRLALLQGLCDTDGTCNKKNGQISFTNNNESICDAVRFLIVSLGGTYANYYRGKSCTITFRLTGELNPFRLERKAKLVRAATKRNKPRRFISSITPVEKRPTICFSVDSPDSLYAAGKDLILTHNTELAVIIWVCWTFIRNPRAQFIHVSYSVDLALKNSAMIRDILKSPCIQKHWPIKMRDSADSKGLWLTEEGGGMKADSSAGAITGFGAGITSWVDGDPFDGCIIADDPIKPDDARSETVRKSVNERFAQTLHSRRNHKKVPMVIVMQRLHVDDPSGFALAGNIMGDTFCHLKLSAIYNGAPLWPYKHDMQQLERMRFMDRQTFSGQYQQEPYIEDGEVFDLSKCRRYTSLPTDEQRTMIVHSWDTAYKAGTHNDPSACLVFHVTATHYYLADVIHGRWEYPELRRRVFELAERDKPDAVLIEDKASGQSLIQELRSASKHPVVAIKPESDKETRARTSAAMVEAELLMLPINATWLASFESELVSFPNGSHDDQVDALSQFLNYMRNNTSPTAFNDFLNRLGY